jgi:prephenate dehydrogenase
MRIAIIGGTGKMGRWLTEFFLQDGHEVVISGRAKARLQEAGLLYAVKSFTSNEEAVQGADYIIISVPIESFQEVVAPLGAHIRSGQAVIDITSTKTVPVEIMHRYIKSGTVLGAHPLFGPGARSVENKNFVLTPTDDAETALAGKVKSYLEDRGARVALMTPREHDEMMSLVLGLSHFIAIVSADTLLGAGRLHPMETAGSSTYKVLLTLIESVLSEDPELYASIQTSLPRVTDFERLFEKKTGEWVDLVATGNRREFARRMKALKVKLEREAPDFVKSYENFYRIVEEL